MNKKGAITWEQIMYAIIAVIALVVLAWIFRDYINQVTGGFGNILDPIARESEQVEEGIRQIPD